MDLIDRAKQKGFKHVADWPGPPKDLEEYRGAFPQNATIEEQGGGYGAIKLNGSEIAVLLK